MVSAADKWHALRCTAANCAQERLDYKAALEQSVELAGRT